MDVGFLYGNMHMESTRYGDRERRVEYTVESSFPQHPSVNDDGRTSHEVACWARKEYQRASQILWFTPSLRWCSLQDKICVFSILLNLCR